MDHSSLKGERQLKASVTLKQNNLPPPGNVLITGAAIVRDCRSDVLEDGAILISHGKIADIGPSPEVLNRHPHERPIDGRGFLIIPGLINAHTHAAMGFFRGRGHGRENMIESFMFPAEKSLTPELLEPLSYSYIYGGLRSGVTCFADHYYHVEGVGRALERFGLRGVIGETVADLGGAFPGRHRWDLARSQIESWSFSDRIKPAVAPHAADTVSPDLLKEMAAYSKSNALPLHMHLSQTAVEYERIQKAHGKSPVQLAAQCGALTPRTLAVHLISATGEDWKILADSGATAGLCTASQMIYERLASLQDIANHHIPFALGTDCAACNDGSDMMAEMRITGLLGRDRGLGQNAKDGTEIDSAIDHLNAAGLLRAFTESPAKVFGLDRQIGTLEAGKAADLVFLRLDLDALPITDYFANLIYSMSSRHVQHVMVDGRWCLWNSALVGVAVEDLEEAFVDAVDIITKRAFS